MKTKLYLIILLLATTSLSCSKDDDDKPADRKTTAELIIGKWNLNSVDYTYYDSANNLLFRDPEEDAQGIWEFDGKVLIMMFTDEGEGSGTYTITQEGEDQYLIVSTSEFGRLRIISIDDHAMVLGDDFAPDSYVQDGIEKPAARSSVRANFTR